MVWVWDSLFSVDVRALKCWPMLRAGFAACCFASRHCEENSMYHEVFTNRCRGLHMNTAGAATSRWSASIGCIKAHIDVEVNFTLNKAQPKTQHNTYTLRNSESALLKYGSWGRGKVTGIDEVVGIPKQSMDIHVPIVPIGSMLCMVYLPIFSWYVW